MSTPIFSDDHRSQCPVNPRDLIQQGELGLERPQLLLDALLEDGQVFFYCVKPIEVQLQQEAMVFFQLPFQGGLQFGNPLA
jgi:hypothetical protein